MAGVLVSQWNNTLEAFANHLIEDDREMKYEQACGLNTSLSLVAATGNFDKRIYNINVTIGKVPNCLFWITQVLVLALLMTLLKERN